MSIACKSKFELSISDCNAYLTSLTPRIKPFNDTNLNLLIESRLTPS